MTMMQKEGYPIMADGGNTNFGMQPSGAASDSERPEGSSMTDRQQTDTRPRSQQSLQMGEDAPQPGERAAREESGGTSSQKARTPQPEGAEGHEAPGDAS
jgi:hypothetical protein